MTIRTARCGVAECGRVLEIDPSQAHQPVICSCGRRTRQSIGLSGTGAWVLRENPYSQDEREEHNLIAQAIVEGQAASEPSWRRSFVDLRSDPTSADLVQSFLASHAASMECARQLVQGQHEAALQAAQRAVASDHAYSLANRRYEQSRRRDENTGRWHDTSLYYVDIAEVRYHFALEGMWVARGTEVEIVNGQEIENRAGMLLGPEAWRNLVQLLQRFGDKPGRKAGSDQLIWRRNARNQLELRSHVKAHYMLAVTALEAIRRTLERQDDPADNGAAKLHGRPPQLEVPG